MLLILYYFVLATFLVLSIMCSKQGRTLEGILFIILAVLQQILIQGVQ